MEQSNDEGIIFGQSCNNSYNENGINGGIPHQGYQIMPESCNTQSFQIIQNTRPINNQPQPINIINQSMPHYPPSPHRSHIPGNSKIS